MIFGVLRHLIWIQTDLGQHVTDYINFINRLTSPVLLPILSVFREHIGRYCAKVYENSGVNLFWSIKNSGEVIDKLKLKHFHVTSLSSYDFSTIQTILPHNLIKD